MNSELIESKLGYVFKDKQLLLKALTLPSKGESYNNQTLEFFGDAILEFIVSEKIYGESSDEGTLTERRKAMVKDDALKAVSRDLGLDKFLIKGKGDYNNQKAVPSAYEAVIAAIYLDGGMEEAKSFVLRTLDFNVAGDDTISDLKTWHEKKYKRDAEYVNCKELGTPQSPLFEIQTEIEGKTFVGRGASKQKAKKSAAKAALEWIKEQGL